MKYKGKYELKKNYQQNLLLLNEMNIFQNKNSIISIKMNVKRDFRMNFCLNFIKCYENMKLMRKDSSKDFKNKKKEYD